MVEQEADLALVLVPAGVDAVQLLFRVGLDEQGRGEGRAAFRGGGGGYRDDAELAERGVDVLRVVEDGQGLAGGVCLLAEGVGGFGVSEPFLFGHGVPFGVRVSSSGWPRGGGG
ncbi:hypothetical protein [Streptomyces sp. NPDC002545]